jgi:hypothetical protein
MDDVYTAHHTHYLDTLHTTRTELHNILTIPLANEFMVGLGVCVCMVSVSEVVAKTPTRFDQRAGVGLGWVCGA